MSASSSGSESLISAAFSTRCISSQPSIPRSMMCPLRSKPKSRRSTASCPGRLAWAFVRRRNSPLIRSSALVVRNAFHCLRKAQKGEQVVARFLEAFKHRWTSQPPLLREADARVIDERASLGVNHPAVIFGERFAQTDRGLGLEIPQLVRGAALNRQRRPLLAPRRRQAGTLVDDGERRPTGLGARPCSESHRTPPPCFHRRPSGRRAPRARHRPGRPGCQQNPSRSPEGSPSAISHDERQPSLRQTSSPTARISARALLCSTTPGRMR